MASVIKLPPCCPLCKDHFKQPRYLPCQDTFCTQCLVDLIINNVQEGKFNCPVCQQSCQAPEEITLNQTFKDMFPIETEFAILSGESVPESAKPKSKPKASKKCRKIGHKNKLLTRYCRGHRQCICTQCEQSAHRSCDVIDVDQQSRLLHQEIIAISHHINNFGKIVSKHSKLTNRAYEIYMDDLKKKREKVKSQTNKKIQKLRDQEQALLDDISAAEQDLVNSKLRLELSRMMEQTRQTKKELKDTTQDSDLMQLVESLDNINLWWEEEQTRQIPTFSWSCDIRTSHEEPRVNMIGHLVVDKKSKMMREMIEETGNRKGGGDGGGPRKWDIKLKCGSPVCGITSVNNRILVMHAGDPQICFCKKYGEHEKTVRVPQLHGPSGCGTIVEIPAEIDTRVCVLDYGGLTMHLLTLSRQLDIVHQQIIQLGYNPYNVTVSRGSGAELVVTAEGSCVVRTYNYQGEEIHQHTAPHQAGSSARCAIKLSTGEYVTREHNAGKLVWSDSTGKRLQEYSNQHHTLDHPLHVTQDLDGDILVSYKHGVMLVHQRGGFIKDVVKNWDIQNPYCLHLADDGWLYVADSLGGDKKLKVLRYHEEQAASTTQLSIHSSSVRATLILYE